jgi:hypothetical protein
MAVRRAWILAAILCVVSCSGGTRNTRVAILLTVSPDGRMLAVGLDSCNAEPVVEIVEQTAERVVLAAVAERNAGGDCADVVSVTLDDPLGDRRLIDGSTGDDVIVDDVMVTEDPVV